jgi:hypothetical protein
MTTKLLLSNRLVNLPIFQLEAKCPYVIIEPLSDETMVNSFFLSNASFLSDVTELGALEVFVDKPTLEYFSKELTKLYPNISHINILDKNSSSLKENTGVENTGVEDTSVENTGVEDTKEIMSADNPNIFMPKMTEREDKLHSKIRFNQMNGRTYFSSPLYILFNYITLIYPLDKTSCTNIMLIDSSVKDAQLFYDSANESTLPVIFNTNTLRGEIINLLTSSVGSLLNRLSIVATDKNLYNNTKLFINGQTYFSSSDLLVETAPTDYSKNMKFMLDLIEKYNIKTIDFLACDSLKFTKWKQYYTILQSHGCTIGASNDKTGNIAYGGDWIMESSSQNIQPIYFTNTIDNYQTTLAQDTVLYLGFGPKGDTEIGNNINLIESTSTTEYTIQPDLKNRTIAVYNTFKTQTVTIYVADIDASNNVDGYTGGYDIQINSMPATQDGNGSNVIIEGKNIETNVNAKLNFRDYTDDAFGGDNGFVTLVDTQSALTGIIIQNIDVLVDSDSIIKSGPLIYTGWVCAGAGGKGNEVTFNSCSIESNGALTISGGDDSGLNGGICGGGYNFSGGNGGKYTFNSCSVLSNSTLTIGGDGGGNYNGGICGGGINQNGNGGTYTFNECSVKSNGTLIIGGDGDGNYNGGICGGGINQNGNGGEYTFNECSVTSTTTLTIGGGDGGNYNGGICGGGYNFSGGNGGEYTFNSCSVLSNSTLTIGGDGGGNYNGGICGGGYNRNGNGGKYTFNECSVLSNSTLIIGGDGGGDYNGGICGGGINQSDGGNGGTYTFNECSVTSTTTLTIGGFHNGGICGGGFNRYDGNGGEYTFNECSVLSNSTLTIGGSYNGGICGGGDNISGGNGGTYTFNECSVLSNSTLTISGDYNGGICGGGDNQYDGNGGTYTFNLCSVESNGALTIGGGDGGDYNGGIYGGGDNRYGGNGGTYTFRLCSIIVTTSITINDNSFDGSFNYISKVQNTITNPQTIADNQLIYGDITNTTNNTYPKSSIVIRSSDMTSIFTQQYINTFKSYNLSGIDLSGVNLSNYDLTGTILTGANLTDVSFNNTTKITDAKAIANNIVVNSGITISDNKYQLTTDINSFGMAALKLGLSMEQLNHSGLSDFVSGLFSALINNNITGFSTTTIVNIPASVIPTLPPWNTSTTNVQLLNSSIFSNINYQAKTIIDINDLDKTNTYFYILLQNYPDTVTIKSGTDNLVISAIGPYNINLNEVEFTCTINNGTPVTKTVGGTIAFAGRVFYIGSASSTTVGTNNVICFKEGTRILTPYGFMPIESLSEGDLVKSKNGATRIKKMISFVGTKEKNPLYVLKKGILGENKPSFDLYMSGDHAFKMDGKWHHMKCSSKAIKTDEDNILYYHIVVDDYFTHTLCAEGIEVESCYDKTQKNIMLWSCDKEKKCCIPLKCELATNNDIYEYNKAKDIMKNKTNNVNTFQQNKLNPERYTYKDNSMKHEIIWLSNMNTNNKLAFKCSEFEFPSKPNNNNKNYQTHLHKMF